ncbi:MAG: Cyclic di-GMP phosphodiesterase response regulator RpfG [Candidatus Dichloromethanomonas elyunquensis]|nr:MAG: Cyclic di-GMP phosphodiesterase response regulator RpfG [Candidatus Dichloromethanomonas elyunquensis]
MKDKNKYKHQAVKISLVYLALGVIWILFSDTFADSFSMDKESFRIFSTYKGWFYVILTGLMLYLFLRKLLKTVQTAEMKIIQNNQDLIAAHEELEATNEEIQSQYEELKTYLFQLKINEDRLNRAQALAHVGNWELDLHGKKIWASAEAFRIYGITGGDSILPLDKAQAVVNREDRPYLDLALANLIQNEEKYDVVFRINREQDGGERIIHSVAVLEKDGQNQPKKILGVIRDITEQYLTEEQLRFYAEHDTLTGLYNRRFFEQIIMEKVQEFKTNGIIVCDVDGLKLINDTLGHQEGDKYLIACAEILRRSCLQGSIIARVGGDEFAVLLKETDQEKVSRICHSISQEVEEYNHLQNSIPLSISMGWAYCGTLDQITFTRVFKEAEEKMYFYKLLHAQSTRSKTVDLLMKTLEARDYITEGHTDRLQKIVEDLAILVGMSELEKSRLSLFARFHDIGKVGIPDAILFKPGKLEPDEYEEMKKHSEIGFRIANSSPDLAHISDLILKHHEWWNGKGYPLGIAGKEIPLECRILAIADAYDSMSNDRPYRKAMSYSDIISELNKFSDIQFDPYLVAVFLKTLR